MKTVIKVWILIALTIVSVIIAKASYRSNFSYFYWEDYMLPLFISASILLLTLVIAVVVSSLIKGQFVKPFFLKYFFWTNIIVLVSGHYMLFSDYYDKLNAYKKENIEHNENYKKFYGDGRDSMVTFAINAIEQKQKEIGDYRIYRMRVIEKDTSINNEPSKFYDIHQFYNIKYQNLKNAYMARHLVIGNQLYEIFDKPYFADSTGFTEKIIYDSLTKKTLTDKSLDEITSVSKDFATDVVKLKE